MSQATHLNTVRRLLFCLPMEALPVLASCVWALGDEDVMARESNGGLRYGALIAQKGKEALHDAETGRHRAGGQLVMERGRDPSIHIRGGGLRQVVIEGGLARLGYQDREAFEGADGAFLHRGGIVARTQIRQIVCDHAWVLGTEKVQPTELREFLECRGGIAFLHTSLLLHKPRSPVEDRELRADCLHNYYSAKLKVSPLPLAISSISCYINY